MKILRTQTLLSFCLILGSLNTSAAISVKTETFENGKTSRELFYDGTSLVEEKDYDDAGDFTGWLRFSYPEKNHVIKTILSIAKSSLGQITSKEEWVGGTQLVRKWIYTEAEPFKFEYIENYDPKAPFRISRKDYLDEKNQLKSTIEFSYSDKTGERPSGFVEKNANGKIMSQFSLYEPYNLEKSLTKVGLNKKEIAAYKRLRENPNKLLIAIIDSGFDYNHQELVTKWWNNPAEKMDGKDNDKNGWADDNFGWDQVRNVGLPTESTIGMQKDKRPLSHGTHVAHIAIKGLDNAALVGFSGDYTQADYIDKISAFLKKNKVKIVNMSLGLPSDNKDMLGLRDAIKSYKRMIDDNPETLFVVASGNAGDDLDNPKNRQYPASFTQPNVLKVGALDASDLKSVTPENAKMAWFSNYGKQNVDILAPGVDIVAASLGGGLIAHSGTSMATPYMVNQIARLWSEIPALNAIQVRELFIKTAQPLKDPAPIRSQGYVDLENAKIRGKIDFLLGKKAKETGPNCWNSASYVAGLSKAVHNTQNGEFAFLIDSPLCKAVSQDQMKAGDIIALRHYDRNGKILPASHLSEFHAYTYVGNGQGFTKNGVDPEAGYEIQSTKDIFDFFKKSDIRNCKIMQIDRPDCNLKEVAYRCTPFEVYMEEHGGLSIYEREVLLKISNLEQHAQSRLFYGQKYTIDIKKAIESLKAQVTELKNLGSSEFVQDYFYARLLSLDTSFGRDI